MQGWEINEAESMLIFRTFFEENSSFTRVYETAKLSFFLEILRKFFPNAIWFSYLIKIITGF